VEVREPRATFKKLHHMGTGIERLLPHAPGLQRLAGHTKPVGGLTLGYPLGLQVAIRVKQFGVSDPISALLALCIATLCGMDCSSHSHLLYRSPCHVRSGGLRMAR